MDPSKSPRKLGKLIGYFEEAPGSPQTQANIIPRKQFSLCVTHAHVFSCLGAHNHSDPAATGAEAGCVGSKGLSFDMKQTLGLGFCFGLFHAGMEGDGTSETQGAASVSTQVLPHHSLPCTVPWDAFFAVLCKSPVSTGNSVNN